MNHLRFAFLIGTLLLMALLPVGAAWAQGGGYSLWWTVDSGGTTSAASSGYTLGGTIGQPEAAVWSGGGYTLSGGFWSEAGDGAMTLYLPVITKGYISGPDLVIDPLTAGSGGPEVVIRNAGNAPVADGFWVDVYFNPTQTPGLNRPWPTIAPAGAVWGVTQSLGVGESLALTVGGAYYDAGRSSASFPVGAQVYGYVDSMNLATNYGGVLEIDETNNLAGPVASTAAAEDSPGVVADAPSATGLPGR